MKRPTHRHLAVLCAAGSLLWLSSFLAAQEAAPESQPASAEPPRAADLSIEQAQLADRWDRLEQIAARLAELSSATDPHRADLLRKALAAAREKEVHLRFETIVEMLEKERYSVATENQESLEAELQQLLELLLKENRAEEVRSQQEWLRTQLKEVNRIIRLQRGVKARTEGGDDSDRLAEDQQKISKRTGGLAEGIEQAKGGAPTSEKGENEAQSSQENAGEQRESADGQAAEGEEKGREDEAESEEQSNSEDESAEESGSPSASGEDSGSSENESQAAEKGSQQSQQGQSQQGQSQQGQSQQGQSQQGQSQQGQSQQGQSQQGQSQQGEQSPSEQQQSSSDPDENLRRRLRTAEENMEQAREKLEEAERSGAIEEQKQALRELEEARAELERILRQLREEEMERTLTLLEARFRKMLEAQIDVYEGTVRLGAIPADARDHDEEIEAGRLSRQEEAIVQEADRAMEILLAEGTSVAFPEAVTQMRADMQDVAGRLVKMQVGELTQQVEQDIIEQLEESIEVLQKALEDLEKNKSSQGQGSPPGEPQDPNLVDKIEEAKMIRALQMRINRRTLRYYEMIGGSGTDNPELLDALRQLAERQDRVYKATRDLDLGRNR